MTAYLHRVDRVRGVTPATQARRRPSRTRREGPEATHMAETLAGEAGTMWEGRWGAFYGMLASPMVGGASTKTLAQKVGLGVVCLVHALRSAAPAGASWAIRLTSDEAGAPVALELDRDGEVITVPVRLDRRSLRVGGHSVFLAGKGATRGVLDALAREVAAFFGAPMRAAEVS